MYNKSEIGAGTRGASLGIDALHMAAINKDSSLFSDYPSITINDNNQVLTMPNDYKWAKHIDSIIPIYEELCVKVSTLLLTQKFPVVISGDHASAGGTIAGIKKAHPNKRLGIIWIDAHADLHSPFTSPSGNVHGMPLATVIGEDNLKFDSGDVKDKTRQKWERLKNVGEISPKARPEDIVFIGVRDTEKEEDYLIKKHNIKNYITKDLRKRDLRDILKEIKEERLKDCDIIYVSFDVDSLDCDSVSLGTGTPVKNGLYIDEVKLILKDLMLWDKLVCLEMTEINPLLDNKKNTMAETALSILEHIISE